MGFRITLFFLFFSVQIFGQDYTLKTVPVRDELNTYLLTSSPFIDKDGFVWYAVNTEGVFYRYDGKNKFEYSFVDKNKKKVSISTPIVYSWLQDNNGTIWAVNLKGAYIINPKTFKVDFIEWNVKDLGFRDFSQVGAIKDSKGNVWVSLAMYYLIKFDTKYKQKTYTNPILVKKDKDFQKKLQVFNKETATVKVVKELPDGRILVQSYSDIYIIDDKGMHFFANSSKFDKDINHNFHFIENGKIFKKNSSGTYYLNDKPYKYSYIKELDIQIFNYPYNNFVYAKSKIFTVDEDKLYINVIDLSKSRFRTIDTINFKKKITNNYLVKANNVLWFSTYDDIFMLKITNGKFKKYLQFKDSQASTRGITSDQKGNLYIGSYTGLYKIFANSKIFTKIYDPKYDFNYYNSLLIENDSVLWATGEGNFIKSINLKNNKIKDFKYKGKIDLHTTFIKPKSKDSLWLGSDKGLYIFDKKSGIISKHEEKNIKLDGLIFYDILKTAEGNLWIATDKGLLLKKKGEAIIDYGKKNDFFRDKTILVLHEDKNKNLWIGTNNSGVALLNQKTGKTEIFDQSKGLSNNTVCGILESKDEIWFSTYYGLSSLNKETKRFNNFYEEDGLSDNEFNIRSFYKKNDTTFYFGGLNGIMELNPKKINYQKKAYKIFLSKSEYFSKAQNKNITDYLDIDEARIDLPYNKNFFSAEFSINDMFYQEKSTYYYKIDGLTNGWVNVGVSGLVKLYGLPPGDYVLCVKGKDFEGFETINEIKIPIRVSQIFFKTPLFMALILILISSFIIYQFKRKARKQRKIFEREKEIIQLKSSALKAQMNPHFVFNILNNMQSVMILKGEMEVNKYFVAFSRLLRLTLDMSKQELVSLKDEIEYINNYLLLNNLQLNEDLNFSVVVDDSIENAENIFLPGMLIQPFVENAILHGLTPKPNDRRLEVNYSIQNEYLVVRIEDNGIGREASAELAKKRRHIYKSWSTEIVTERIKIINATQKGAILLEIQDRKEENKTLGTTVILKFIVNFKT